MEHNRVSIKVWARRNLLCFSLLVCVISPLRAEIAADNKPEMVGPPAPAEAPAEAATPPTLAVKPRLELFIPSIQRLWTEAHRAHSGVFLQFARDMLLELADKSTEGLGQQEIDLVVAQARNWPDSAVAAATYAPDYAGRLRWIMRVDWPVTDVQERLKSLLATELAREALRGLALTPRDDAIMEVRLDDYTLFIVRATDDGAAIIASHDDLQLPDAMYRGEAADADAGPALLACRMNLAQTEQDSGATLLSSFSAFTDLVYTGHVAESGEWIEKIAVNWPPISGMGAKVFFSRVKQNYFAPADAFGSAAMNSMMLPGMLESMLGFGAQFMADGSGGFEMVGEPGIGPVASRLDGETCVTVLPGAGFLPMPDIVVQARLKRAGSFVEDVRKAIEEVNKLHLERDLRTPWHESTVRDRTIFWSEGGNPGRSLLMPLVMHPVVFATRELDAKGKERDYMVLAWTSTSAERFVARWLDLPRPAEGTRFPEGGKTDGQITLHWAQIYRWVHPYIDMALSAASMGTLLPSDERIKDQLTNATITADLKYTGISFNHRGPLPVAALLMPTLLETSIAVDDSGSGDLARERLAGERLRVLYHHSKLFKKDLGRWPAEVAELDGYVDFKGNPRLLELELSSKKRWSEWFSGLLELDEDDESDDDLEDDADAIDDDLFVIKWGRQEWSLGIKPGTFEHLEQLFIDQDGRLHRVPASKNQGTEPAAKVAANAAADGQDDPAEE